MVEKQIQPEIKNGVIMIRFRKKQSHKYNRMTQQNKEQGTRVEIRQKKITINNHTVQNTTSRPAKYDKQERTDRQETNKPSTGNQKTTQKMKTATNKIIQEQNTEI